MLGASADVAWDGLAESMILFVDRSDRSQTARAQRGDSAGIPSRYVIEGQYISGGRSPAGIGQDVTDRR